MIGLGILLLIAALLFPKLAALWGVGSLLLFVGIILALLGAIGHAVGGRRHYY
jgi:disulfide bond formation protein DsbB